MKITLSVIKADIGSVGGHAKPSREVFETVTNFIATEGRGLLADFRTFHTGDDIAILMSHQRGPGNEKIHKLAWDAFLSGTKVAKEQGLYGAGQDLLVEAFSGNVRGMGPAVAELEFEERLAEPFILFMADKTDPGAFNLPFFLTFADPFHNAGLILAPEMSKGFTFDIMDVSFTGADRVIRLNTPEDYYKVATLLRDPETYVIESIFSRDTGEQAAAISTSRLHNIAGKYTGKDDPVALVRIQKQFPDAGELLSPYALTPLVAGDNRGSHHTPMMPVKLYTSISYWDGPCIVSGASINVHGGKFTDPHDVFEHPFWDYIRDRASEKFLELRRQGFFGPAMVGMNELEYTGVVDQLKELDKLFKVRGRKTKSKHPSQPSKK